MSLICPSEIVLYTKNQNGDTGLCVVAKETIAKPSYVYEYHMILRQCW